jgi:hypothetical protein
MDSLQEKITETLSTSPSGVHAILYGPKTKANNVLNQDGLVFLVEKKLPISQLTPDEIIPKIISLDGSDYVTDVVESPKFKRNQCYSLTDSKVVKLQSRLRPLSGGIEISALSTWGQTSPYQFNYSVGTVGFLAKDNEDNKLVGVTNNHVIVQDAFVSSEKDPDSITSSIVDSQKFTNGLTGTYSNRILQFGSVNGTVNFSNDKVGTPKRYVSIYENQPNHVDGALFTIDPSVFNSSSCSQTFLPDSYAMPFCSTTEVNTLSTNLYPIYNVGRTTGPKGTNCPLVVYGYGSVSVPFLRQDEEVEAIFSNVLFYRFQDSSNLPIYYGDSGSCIVANINGSLKIAGLAFAGNSGGDMDNPTSSLAVASRIDKVAQELNISAWDGSSINSSGSTPKILQLIRPYTDTRTSIISGGKKFYLAGTVFTNTPYSNV